MDLKKSDTSPIADPVHIQEKRSELKSLQEKCDLQSKKIKLFRKENQEIKHALVRQAQVDTSLLLASKQLSDANSKLQSAIQDISRKLEIDLENIGESVQAKGPRLMSLVTIQNTTVTEETQEVDLPGQGIGDDQIIQLQNFRGLKSLILGENKIGDVGVTIITNHLTSIVKLQLNSNSFTASALANISNLQNLRVLDIRNNNLGDNCMIHLSTLIHLQQLSISKNGITDSGIQKAQTLTNLTYLDLTTNLLTDQGVFYLLPLQKLTHLYLMSNRVTEQSVYRIFEKLLVLQVLDVRFNVNDQTKKQLMRERKPQKIQLFC